MRSESFGFRVLFACIFFVVGLALFEGIFHLEGWDLLMVPFNLLFSFFSLWAAYLALVEGPPSPASSGVPEDAAAPKALTQAAPPAPALSKPVPEKHSPSASPLAVQRPVVKPAPPKPGLTEFQLDLLLNDRRKNQKDPVQELQGFKNSIARFPLENAGLRRSKFRLKPVLDEDQWEREMAAKLRGSKCPECGSLDLGVILWGQLPVGDGRTNHLMRLKLLVPGGCFMGEEDILCNDCGAYWVSGKRLSEFGRGGFRRNPGGAA